MKQLLTLLVFLLGLYLLPIGPNARTKAQQGGKIAINCPPLKTLNQEGIAGCPDTGCGGSLDPLLNKQKNVTAGDADNTRHMEFAEFAAIPNKIQGYKGIGFPRDKVKEQGEGDMVRVVAWAIDSRPQKSKKGESCNCGFNGSDPKQTDVHIVLIDDATLKLKAKATPAKPPSEKNPKGVKAKSAAFNTLKKREALSQTVEYTPRVRVARNEEFDGSKLKKMITANDGALRVRVTGLLFYDSEHALGPLKLLRKTDWEIHPVYRLEFCPKDKTCPDKGDDNWVDINK